MSNNKDFTVEPTRLGDIRVGDWVVDVNGEPTRVLEVTNLQPSNELYKLTFYNVSTNVQSTIVADGEHVWPLNSNPTVGSIPPEWSGETEVTSRIISDWCARGFTPELCLTYANDNIVHIIVRDCVQMNVKEAEKHKVLCLKVDSPTHSFLICDNSTNNGEISGVEAVEHSVPTHNCGGPLTLDTVIPLFNDETTTMGDIKVGDEAKGVNGEKVNILAKSPAIKPEYCVELVLERDMNDLTWSEQDLLNAEKNYYGTFNIIE